jgi:hypothetical protein
MGGYGSGSRFGTDCTDDYQSIDIRRWQREGLISPGQHISWQWLRNGDKVASIGAKVEAGQILLIYSYQRKGEEREHLEYPVRLQTTACHYGGIRYWFTCPAAGCGRRVALLYLGRKYFACRKCYQLSYRSQREVSYDRAARQADKIRDKLDWELGILNGNGWKPKGMHWKTFYRLAAKHDVYTNKALMDISAKLGIIADSLMF